MKTPLVNCKKCGVLFAKTKRSVCDICVEKEKELAKVISKYVDKSPELYITLQSISEGTEIGLSEVEEIYSSSLLLTYVTNKITVECRICHDEKKGSEMKGYFCDECLERLGLLGCDPTKIKVELKKFHKDVMHTRVTTDENGLGRGFKSKKD